AELRATRCVSLARDRRTARRRRRPRTLARRGLRGGAGPGRHLPRRHLASPAHPPRPARALRRLHVARRDQDGRGVPHARDAVHGHRPGLKPRTFLARPGATLEPRAQPVVRHVVSSPGCYPRAMSDRSIASGPTHAGAVPSRGATPAIRATTFSIILSLSFCHLLNDMMQSLVPALYPILKNSYGLTFSQVG